jgi:hypothetical protein
MENQTHTGAALPGHAFFAVFDRKADALPAEKCAIEILKNGEWVACEWHPRTPESEADAGYLGTAWATRTPPKIGYHAWEQNDYEFRYFCLPANAEVRHGAKDARPD